MKRKFDFMQTLKILGTNKLVKWSS